MCGLVVLDCFRSLCLVGDGDGDGDARLVACLFGRGWLGVIGGGNVDVTEREGGMCCCGWRGVRVSFWTRYELNSTFS
jgi:hypothetical protein